ncbi:MAG: phosphate ABC transporter permease subunit PstC, partial [Methanobacterium sp.]
MARNWEEFLVEKVLLLAAISSIIIILLIIGFVIQQGIPAMEQVGPLNFIFGMDWSPSYGLYGVFPMIVGSLGMTALALLFAVPLSIFGAIFLAEVAPKNMRKILKPTIQTLAGIPSVIYGFFGLIVLVPFMRIHFGGSGFSMLT